MLVLSVVTVVLFLTVYNPFGPSSNDTSPVDLSTPVNMDDGLARQSAIVRVGEGRIEVLSPTLLRLEYSPAGNFEDSPTVNAINRRMPVPRYSARVSGGWLTLRTSQAMLRYKVGSGPFTAANTSVRFADGTHETTVHPTWEWECPFDQTCQAGAAVLRGGAGLSWSQSGYQSSAGYVGNLFHHGASATWTVLGAPAGRMVLSVRYTNVVSPPSTPRTIDLIVNGHLLTNVQMAPTDSAQPWSTVTTTASLKAGANSVEVRCGSGNNCNVGVDTISIGPADAAAPAAVQTDPLGGWIRSFDTFTYGDAPTCSPGTNGPTCQTTVEPLHTDGLLNRAGWRLLDDTQSALWTPQGWVQRREGGDVEDGYLFVYGQGYVGALHTFAQLTGSAPLLPRDVFGVWYSDYTPYSSHFIQSSLYPAFQKDHVPLNTLSLDTDWKAPNSWNGWEWNTALFPHPSAFLHWARSAGIDVTLNIHSSIDIDDPKMPAAQSIAGTTLPTTYCVGGICKVWDWSSVSQAESNFSLQQSFQQEGVAFWWLDWCCDASTVSMPGLTPDAWIGHLYAQEMVNRGQRGFVLARIGSSNGNPQRVYPAGPWSDHTSAIAFTGDTWGTWNILAQEVALTPAEGTIGEPYVSDDIGSYLGPPPQGTEGYLAPPVPGIEDPADLYDRWVQFGTFQPILRLHSDKEERLPWQYPQPVRDITDAFLRLREALIPYTYTLAAQAHDDGLPMAQPLYLDYPEQEAAYLHPGEYLYGSDMLVAPVTSPGGVAATTVWIPPGRWVDYFTGATFSGPTTTTLSVPLSRMPVLVRAGGIIPEQSSSTTSSPTIAGHLVLEVFPGSTGRFNLYSDSGTGLGYTKGQYTDTPITDSVASVGEAGMTTTCRVTVGAAHGHYPGEPRAVGYHLDMVDLTQPSLVMLNGRRLDQRAPGSDAAGWYYQAATATVVANTPSLSTTRAATVLVVGGQLVSRSEPPTPSP
ncbi:MAG TPA: TIM-barrel domain-containing protein [Acidimicrobiales bacterium]|nr:TIM-barrel domain-containing protein [Acidimicrobiales bacterium]